MHTPNLWHSLTNWDTISATATGFGTAIVVYLTRAGSRRLIKHVRSLWHALLTAKDLPSSVACVEIIWPPGIRKDVWRPAFADEEACYHKLRRRARPAKLAMLNVLFLIKVLGLAACTTRIALLDRRRLQEVLARLTGRESAAASLAMSAGAPTPTFGSQEAVGCSSSGQLHYDLRGHPHEHGVEVWLRVEESVEEDAIKLCDTQGWGNLRMHFSPDDRWLLVQDGGPSLGIHLRLFRRAGEGMGASYQELEDVDLGSQVERLALQQAGWPDEPRLHHRYARCLAWAADSKSALIRVGGYGGGCQIKWVGVYEVGTGQFHTDLGRFNGGAVDPASPAGTATKS